MLAGPTLGLNLLYQVFVYMITLVIRVTTLVGLPHFAGHHYTYILEAPSVDFATT